MNDIASDKRNSLKVNTLASLMFIKLNGPEIGDFDPTSFVKTWLTTGGRLSTTWKSGLIIAKSDDSKSKVSNWVV